MPEVAISTSQRKSEANLEKEKESERKQRRDLLAKHFKKVAEALHQRLTEKKDEDKKMLRMSENQFREVVDYLKYGGKNQKALGDPAMSVVVLEEQVKIYMDFGLCDDKDGRKMMEMFKLTAEEIREDNPEDDFVKSLDRAKRARKGRL